MPDLPVSIVDDDAAVRLSLAAVLEAAGYSARLYGTGEGFLAAGGEPTRFVILDLHLPDIDGLEVLRRYRAGSVPAPVVMISGGADPGRRARAKAGGAVDLLAKPIAQERLLEMIGRAG
jgi:two-component system response regulator FixJ